MLLAFDIPEKDLEWFIQKGILITKCQSLFDGNQNEEQAPHNFDTFILFSPEFKKWKNIVFFGPDTIIKSSIKRLTSVRGFASPALSGELLKSFFIPDKDPDLFSALNKKYNLNASAFDSSVMAFSADIIEEGTYHALRELSITYKNLSTGINPILNLYFQKKWKRLSILYNIRPKSIENKAEIDSRKLKGIVFNLNEGEISKKNTAFYLEWKKNLGKADQIDLGTQPEAKKTNVFSLLYFSLFLSIKTKLRQTFSGSGTKRNKNEKYPSSFIIQITDSCMARCHQCDNWRKKEYVNELNTDEKLRLIEEIYNLNKDVTPYIHFGGGEPFLKKEEVLKLAGFCKQKNIQCGVDTTGYLIDEETARQIASTDMTVQVSLDSMSPEIHDEMRRLENCHQRAIDAVNNLVSHVGKDHVITVTVFSKKNLDEIEKLIKFAREKGIRFYLQPLMYSIVKDPDYILDEYWPYNTAELDRAFQTINKLEKQGVQNSYNRKRLSDFKKYFVTGIPQMKCNYLENNLFIDCMGDVKLCFNSGVIGNIRKNTLKEICSSEQVKKAKNELRYCNINCNIPVLQHFPDNRMQKLKKLIQPELQSFFSFAFRAPDRIMGKTGSFMKKYSPGLYHTLKKLKGGE